ncbi:MAG: hypothetical protein LIO80_09265 [Lachnospiraceae bacterium]|nr:hypothetical protein [Lachnospiraceae bacterium]
MSAINKLLERRDSVRSDYEEVNPMLFDAAALETEQEKLPTALDTFDETAFHSLVDYITVYSSEDVRVTFKDGTEIISEKNIHGFYYPLLYLFSLLIFILQLPLF